MKLLVAKHLNEREYSLFLQVYAKHNSSMGMEQRKNYTLSDIVKVKRNRREDCLNVYYENGDWWHYSTNGKWY